MLALALSAVLVAPTAGAGASVSSRRLDPYAGLGTWLPIYVFAKKAWRNPEQQVAAMARNGARTLYLETGNYKQRVDLVRARAVGRFVDAAHAAVGPAYALGAITPSPVGMSPSYWPGIPYRALARSYDVFLPMAYSTLRGVRGSRATRAYLSATVAAIRTGSGNPKVRIHLVGGLSGKMGVAEIAGFMHAVADCAPLGYSLYAFPGTHRAAWTALNGR
jgi:hypothetical protein